MLIFAYMGPKINTKSELTSTIITHQEDLKKFGVMRLGIFGSFVNNNVSEKSDIDLLIDFNPEYKTLKNFIGLSNFLSQLTGRKIEIVTPQSLNKFIGKYILQEVEYVPFTS